MDGRFRPGDRCVLSLRPENARLDEACADGENRVNGRITFAAYMGHTLRYDVDVGQSIVLKVDIRDAWHHEPRTAGASVCVSFAARSTIAIRDEP
jgi:hypothetical protein